MMFMNPHEPTAYIAPTLVGLSGAVGGDSICITRYCKEFQKRNFSYKKIYSYFNF